MSDIGKSDEKRFGMNRNIIVSIPKISPFKHVEPKVEVVRFVNKNLKFNREMVSLRGVGNPYVTPAEYFALTGMALNDTNGEMRQGIASSLVKGGCINDGAEERILVLSDGLYLKSDKANAKPRKITNFDFNIFELLERYKRDGLVVKEVRYTVSGHETEPKTISYEEYGSGLIDNILRDFPDCCLVGGNVVKSLLKELAAARFKYVAQNTLPKRIFEYQGWENVDGKMMYLSSARSDCICECYVPEISYKYEKEIWINGLDILNIGRSVLTDNGEIDCLRTYQVSLPFFLYLHMGFSSKLFQEAGLNLQFILVVVGKSGSLKTSTCKAFAEPFHPDGMLRLESTPRALELYRESCLDQTMIADDIFCQNGTVMAKFEDILRAFGDEIGRAKSAGANYGEIVRTHVRGGCIVTAENTPNAQQSSALRYVVLKFYPDSIDTDVLAKFQDNQRLCRRGGTPSIVQNYFAGWIHFLERNYEEVVSLLERFNPPPITWRFRRHSQVYKAFAAIAFLILKWGVEIGSINENDAEQQFNIWLEIIVNLLKANEDLAISSEPWQQFILFLQKGIGTGAGHLAGSKSEYESGSGKYIGFSRRARDGKMEYVLSPEATYAFVKLLMQNVDKKLIATPMSIFHDLYEHGISKGYANQSDGNKKRNRYLKRVMLHNHLVEMLIIVSEEMENAVKNLSEE